MFTAAIIIGIRSGKGRHRRAAKKGRRSEACEECDSCNEYWRDVVSPCCSVKFVAVYAHKMSHRIDESN